MPITLSCVSNEIGGDLVGNAVWLGAPLAGILERSGEGHRRRRSSGERLTASRSASRPRSRSMAATLIAVGMNGEPLPVDHGFRLVVPGLYGYVSATKWLEEIELTTLDAFDVLGATGWAKEAPVKTAPRIDVPRGDVEAGRIAVAGVAWAPPSRHLLRGGAGGRRPVARRPPGAVASDDTWVQWACRLGRHARRVPAQVPRLTAMERCRSKSVRPRIPDGATGYHTRTVSVS